MTGDLNRNVSGHIASHHKIQGRTRRPWGNDNRTPYLPFRAVVRWVFLNSNVCPLVGSFKRSWVASRPDVVSQSFRLAGTGEADLIARLDHIEPLGAETLLHFDTPLTVSLNDAVPSAEGDTLGIVVDRTRIHVFAP